MVEREKTTAQSYPLLSTQAPWHTNAYACIITQFFLKVKKLLPGIVAHTLNPSTRESEAQGCESGVRKVRSSRPHIALTKNDGVSDKGQHRDEDSSSGSLQESSLGGLDQFPEKAGDLTSFSKYMRKISVSLRLA